MYSTEGEKDISLKNLKQRKGRHQMRKYGFYLVNLRIFEWIFMLALNAWHSTTILLLVPPTFQQLYLFTCRVHCMSFSDNTTLNVVYLFSFLIFLTVIFIAR